MLTSLAATTMSTAPDRQAEAALDTRSEQSSARLDPALARISELGPKIEALSAAGLAHCEVAGPSKELAGPVKAETRGAR